MQAAKRVVDAGNARLHASHTVLRCYDTALEGTFYTMRYDTPYRRLRTPGPQSHTVGDAVPPWIHSGRDVDAT